MPTRVWLVLILAASALPRLALLARSSVYHDEAWSILCARLPLPEMIALIRADAGEPVYFILLKGWIALFGLGEMACASLSVVLSMLNIGLVFAFARRLVGDRAALLATLFLGFNWLDFHFSTYIRFYPLLTTVSILSYHAFLAALNRDRTIGWYVLVSAIGFYTHSYYWFICFSQFLVLLVFARADIPRFLFAGVPVALVYAPWFFFVFLHQMTGYVSSYMDTNLDRVDGPWHALALLGRSFVSKHSLPTWTAFFAVAGAVAYLAVVFRQWRKNQALDAERRAVAMLIVAYCSAIGTPILISIVKPIYWMNHYDVALVPVSSTLLAYAVYRLNFGTAAKTVRLLLCLAIPALALPYMRYEIGTKMDGDRACVQRLAADLTADDIIVTTGLSYVQTKYYLDLYQLEYKALVLYPPDLTPARPQYLASRYKRDPEAREELREYAAALAGELEQSGFRRLFVFYQDDPVAQPLKRAFDAPFETLEELPVLHHPWGPFHDTVLVYGAKGVAGPGA